MPDERPDLTYELRWRHNGRLMSRPLVTKWEMGPNDIVVLPGNPETALRVLCRSIRGQRMLLICCLTTQEDDSIHDDHKPASEQAQ